MGPGKPGRAAPGADAPLGPPHLIGGAVLVAVGVGAGVVAATGSGWHGGWHHGGMRDFAEWRLTRARCGGREGRSNRPGSWQVPRRRMTSWRR
ncbi:MAG: hypothetical protein R3D25_05880 [Geminicoccaceae bacterium]